MLSLVCNFFGALIVLVPVEDIFGTLTRLPLVKPYKTQTYLNICFLFVLKIGIILARHSSPKHHQIYHGLMSG